MNCPKCKTPTLVGWLRFERYYKCRTCLDVFWWDGPSLFTPHSPHRKLYFSDKVIKVTDVQCEQLAPLGMNT